MQLLARENIVDLIPYADGVIIAQITKNSVGENKLTYRSYSVKTDEFFMITKGVYLINKFGQAYETISEKVNNFVACDAFLLEDRRCFVLTPDAKAMIFDHNGDIIFHREFMYHNNILRSGVCTGKYIWCTVPKENCLVQYDANSLKVHLRIGSVDAPTFSSPYSLYSDCERIYIANSGNGTVSEMELDTYAVKKIREFKEPVYKYLNIYGSEIVWLKSGIYINKK